MAHRARREESGFVIETERGRCAEGIEELALMDEVICLDLRQPDQSLH
jgi:hypothetical protein